MAELRFTQQEVDRLAVDDMFVDTMAGKTPHHLIRLRNLYLGKVENCAKDMVKLGLAERAVEIQAAQAVLVAQSVRQAMEAEGLDTATIQRVGARLRELPSNQPEVEA